MKILFMGTPDFAVPSLQMLIDSTHALVGVVTQPDKPQGRKQILTPPPVKTLAQAHGIPVYQPDSLKDEALMPLLQQTQPDLIVVVAYGKILPKYVLEFPSMGCVNVHGSLLPRWRGAAPIQWSVIAGDRFAGVATMKMAEGLDTGDILLMERTEIGARETAGELFDRLSHLGADVLRDTLPQLEAGKLVGTPQDDTQATYASMLDKEMAVVDWSKSAHEIDCLIRGLNPWPVALTTLEGARMKLFAAMPEQASGAAGTVLEADTKKGLLVACGEGALRIMELQMVGGKRMAAKDYLRGHQIALGTKLGD
ncbi:MAG: methionyl-tRNA formyltransferase [Butyricicoccus pullicaecorum]|nr:methionyl-tRNA formyltransferase [Butyricicoccus pullicaecorum]